VRPCRHRFGGAIPKAAPQRAAICNLKMEPVHEPDRLIRQLVGDANRLAEMSDCLGICRALQRLLARLAPPLESYLAQPRLGEVVCNYFRLGFGAVGENFPKALERFGQFVKSWAPKMVSA